MKNKILFAALVSGSLLIPAANFAAGMSTGTMDSQHHYFLNAGNKGGQTMSSQVNINQADARTLATLKGITMKKANAIVAYRTSHGSFKSPTELLRVRGVTKRIITINKNRITTG